MPRALCCQFCRTELDPAQEFTFLVESLTVDNPAMLATIRKLPHTNGRPLRVCRGCETRVACRAAATSPRRGAPALLTAVAAVGVWALTAKLSQWLTDGV